MWHRCTMEIERVRLGLRAAGTDPGACAHAAREGAAVLAAWSIDLEGEQPGPLARASRQLARSAELSASTPAPLARRPPSRASGLALFMLAAGRPDSAVGWLLVCRELGLLAGEIGRVHRARGELQRAHEIETDLHGELEQIRARLDADRPDPGPVELDAETRGGPAGTGAARARDPRGAAAPGRRRRRRGGQAADRSNPPSATAPVNTADMMWLVKAGEWTEQLRGAARSVAGRAGLPGWDQPAGDLAGRARSGVTVGRVPGASGGGVRRGAGA